MKGNASKLLNYTMYAREKKRTKEVTGKEIKMFD